MTESLSNNTQKTKIIATIGPATSSYEMLKKLAEEGVDVFRLNFSHGSHEVHEQTMNHILKLRDELGIHLSILADLQGPKIRIGKIEGETVPIEPGNRIKFVNEEIVGNAERVYMSYEDFPASVSRGERILLDDGKVEMVVIETNGRDEVELEIVHGTTLSSNKGVNLPDTPINLPCLTEKDLEDLKFVLTKPVNWIALSFVRHARDVKELREYIDEAGHKAKIISKIEKPEAVENIDKIIKHSNAIMVARGDLGIEVPIEKLPTIQKKIVKKCIQRARPVIIATQMMDSMITNPSPTRAEVTDVANAVLDGADCVMLSGETSVGKFPVRTVTFMNRILTQAEEIMDISEKRPKSSKKSSTYHSDVICLTAGRIANEIGVKGIVGFTVSGYTAFMISSYRPNSPLYIFSSDRDMLCTLNLVWGVECFYYDEQNSTDQTIEDTVRILKNSGKLVPGDTIVNTGAMPLHKKLTTNFCKITIVD